MVKFIVPLAPVTKKNSQQIFVSKKTGRPFITPSKQFKQYENAALWFVPKGTTIDYPVNVKCLFFMPTKRKVDLTNLEEAIDDIMVEAGLLKDDNSNIVAGHDGSRVLYDKNNPRTEVYIEPIENVTE